MEKAFMGTNKRRTRAQDPLLAEIERELGLGRFIRYGDMFDFVAGLEQVEQKLATLVSGGEADRAVGLYEAFLAGCYEKIEECDDSGGYLGMFWDDLFCGWVKARQAAGRPSSETVQQILKWQERDDYGFCYDIEKDVAKVLNPEAYEALVAHYRKTVENGLAGLSGQKPCAIFEYDNSIRLPAMTLKEMYRARGDIASYAAVCERDDAAAAKLYRAMGFRILNAKKSKYYENALANFENARDLYRKAGLESEWAALVETVRAEHARKYGFMPGFEKITSGGSAEGPSFAERARARWARQMGTGGS
jgi:hypothetical protein